jgi:hypothetical protein
MRFAKTREPKKPRGQFLGGLFNLVMPAPHRTPKAGKGWIHCPACGKHRRATKACRHGRGKKRRV